MCVSVVTLPLPQMLTHTQAETRGGHILGVRLQWMSSDVYPYVFSNLTLLSSIFSSLRLMRAQQHM